jgi:GTPase SAR1 family protein
MENIINRKFLEKVKSIAVYGDCGSGKTALVYRILKEFPDKQVYFIKHPCPELIEEFGYKNIRNIELLERLSDCVIYYDEPQLTTNIYDKKTNSIIAKICSLARQRNIILIISSSDTRVFTKHNESYFDLWLIKDVDYKMVKNGSKIKKAIKDNSILDAEGFYLEQNEFISESRKLIDLNGKHTFELINEWSEELSKPYKIKNSEKNAEKIGEEVSE